MPKRWPGSLTVGSRFFSSFRRRFTTRGPLTILSRLGSSRGPRSRAKAALDQANKREAISHAVFTVLRTFAPQHRRALIERMEELGDDPTADTLPVTVGGRAAEAVLAACRDDGANEAGNFADHRLQAADVRTAGRLAADRVVRRAPATTPQWSRVKPFRRSHAYQLPGRRRLPEPPSGRGKSMC